MKRILLALALAAITGLLARPARAIDTVPLPERPVYRTTTYTGVMFYRLQLPGVLLFH